MNYSELINRIRTNFAIGMQRKTGWGKNEVVNLLDGVLISATTEELDNFIMKQKAFHLLQQKKDNEND